MVEWCCTFPPGQSRKWKEMCTTIWNDHKLQLLPDRRILILSYSYTRPSRPRCGLYFYRETIRAATLWSTKHSTLSVGIEINSDLQLCHRTFAEYLSSLGGGRVNSTGRVYLHWEGPLYKENLDILYLVARALYHLVYQDNRPEARKIKVSVRYKWFRYGKRKKSSHSQRG
jgi:hypothetical protein